MHLMFLSQSMRQPRLSMSPTVNSMLRLGCLRSYLIANRRNRRRIAYRRNCHCESCHIRDASLVIDNNIRYGCRTSVVQNRRIPDCACDNTPSPCCIRKISLNSRCSRIQSTLAIDPSTSVSLSFTSRLTGVSSLVLALSLTAVGGSFTGLMVRANVLVTSGPGPSSTVIVMVTGPPL